MEREVQKKLEFVYYNLFLFTNKKYIENVKKKAFKFFFFIKQWSFWNGKDIILAKTIIYDVP